MIPVNSFRCPRFKFSYGKLSMLSLVVGHDVDGILSDALSCALYLGHVDGIKETECLIFGAQGIICCFHVHLGLWWINQVTGNSRGLKVMWTAIGWRDISCSQGEKILY